MERHIHQGLISIHWYYPFSSIVILLVTMTLSKTIWSHTKIIGLWYRYQVVRSPCISGVFFRSATIVTFGYSIEAKVDTIVMYFLDISSSNSTKVIILLVRETTFRDLLVRNHRIFQPCFFMRYTPPPSPCPPGPC